ncbi:hypothetical protein M0805_003184 [Coniferiporia weirii]|nr:hypothetical protein M0805_003184 [Coniferiporia weirii]
MSYNFAENLTIDLHDLAGVILRERLLTEPRFMHSRLLEVCDGAWPASCIPIISQDAWMNEAAPKVGYFLTEPKTIPRNARPIEPHNFLCEKIICPRELDTEEVETIFWRVRHHDSGYMLAQTLQFILDSLPASTMLRLRTSQGHAIRCKASSFAVAEVQILPKRKTYICNFIPRPDLDPYKFEMSQYLTGDRFLSTPWVYLVFGESDVATSEIDTDRRVAVDLVSLMLGMRGLGGEMFAMERLKAYHHTLLASVAEEDANYVLSERIRSPDDEEKARPAKELAKLVLARLEKITRGEETFCAYCGKVSPSAQCSRCRGSSRYCGSVCQKKAWKYHKVWCKIDAAAKSKGVKKDVDVKMADA